MAEALATMGRPGLAGPDNPRWHNLTGQRFGRLVPRAYVRTARGWLWRCDCDCGAVAFVHARLLKRRRPTRSCGCLLREYNAACMARKINSERAASARARQRRRPEYRVWRSLVARCTDPRHPGYRFCGARGVAVAPEWLGPAGFARFLADVGPHPSPGYTLAREGATPLYGPGTCHWKAVANSNGGLDDADDQG